MYLGDEFVFSPEDTVVEQCLSYAREKALFNDHYRKKRRANPEKMEAQDAYSKYAEFAVKDFIGDLGFKFDVDTKIYKPSEKSWDADLGKNISVKSTSLQMCGFISRNTNGESKESWTVQYQDEDGIGGKDRIFTLNEEDQKKEYFVFATVEHENIKPGTKVWIRGFWKLNRLHTQGMFKDPIADYLKGIKKNIYDGDMKKVQAKYRGKA